jgi:hypothetical protein
MQRMGADLSRLLALVDPANPGARPTPAPPPPPALVQPSALGNGDSTGEAVEQQVRNPSTPAYTHSKSVPSGMLAGSTGA